MDTAEAQVERADAEAGAGAVASAYDPFHEPLLTDPYPFFARARSDAPVFYAENIDHWLVSRYEDVKAILCDPATYSVSKTIASITPLSEEAVAILRDGRWGQRRALGNNDPPDHARFRRNVQRAFTPRRVAEFEPFIRATGTDRVDRFAGDGTVDLMAALVYDLTTLVILELLGIPDDGVPIFRDAGDNRVAFVWGRPSAEEQVRLAAAMVRFWHYLRGLIDERLASPGNDLTSALLAVRDRDDYVFTLDEIASVLFALLTAGHETTSSLIGNVARRLLERRTVWDELCSDPDLIPGAVEEVLRHDGPVVAWRRRTKRGVEIAGTVVPPNAQVFVVLGPANRDEAAFDDPDMLDIRRSNASAHLSFGHGIHFCLGAALARREARVVFEVLTVRSPLLRLVEGQEIRFVPNTSFRVPLSLEVQWDV